jgi:hypothetical protein
MQHTSPTLSSSVEKFQISPMSASTVSDVDTPNDTHYSSLLLKKKLAIFDSASKATTAAAAAAAAAATDSTMTVALGKVRCNRIDLFLVNQTI